MNTRDVISMSLKYLIHVLLLILSLFFFFHMTVLALFFVLMLESHFIFLSYCVYKALWNNTVVILIPLTLCFL